MMPAVLSWWRAWKQNVWGRFSRDGLAIAAAMFALDTASRISLLAFFQNQPGRRIYLTPFLDLVMVWNTGVSYGLFQTGSALGRGLLSGLAAVIIAVVVVWLARVQTRFLALALGLVIGGALANLADRLIHGAVADFFSLHAYGFYWYVFNIADVGIVLGALMILWDGLFRRG